MANNSCKLAIDFGKAGAAALRLLLFSMLLPLLVFPQTAAAAVTPQFVGCGQPAAHAFDFWIGDWDIQQKILQKNGTWQEFPAQTSVWAALDGCALVEHWSGKVLLFWKGMQQARMIKGLSVRSYDPQDGSWSIYWMDTLSPQFGKPYTGKIIDGHGEFFREWDTPQGKRQGRIIFTQADKDAVNWKLAISSDGGHSWLTIWIMAMRRHIGTDASGSQ